LRHFLPCVWMSSLCRLFPPPPSIRPVSASPRQGPCDQEACVVNAPSATQTAAQAHTPEFYHIASRRATAAERAISAINGRSTRRRLESRRGAPACGGARQGIHAPSRRAPAIYGRDPHGACTLQRRVAGVRRRAAGADGRRRACRRGAAPWRTCCRDPACSRPTAARRDG